MITIGREAAQGHTGPKKSGLTDGALSLVEGKEYRVKRGIEALPSTRAAKPLKAAKKYAAEGGRHARLAPHRDSFLGKKTKVPRFFLSWLFAQTQRKMHTPN